MIIVIDVEAFYDWIPTTEKPSEADVLALKYKPSDNGKWLKKTVVEKQTHTYVSLPEEQIQDCMAGFERRGAPKSRARTVAWYLEEITMPHNAHPDHFLKITVHDEPEVEAYLNKYFDTDAVKESK